MISALLLMLALQHAAPVTIITPVRPAETSVIGTIERVVEAERTLTLQTSDGARLAFVVATDATIRMGPRTLGLHDLSEHNGRKAKVRYTVSNGRRTAHWVAISSDPPKGR